MTFPKFSAPCSGRTAKFQPFLSEFLSMQSSSASTVCWWIWGGVKWLFQRAHNPNSFESQPCIIKVAVFKALSTSSAWWWSFDACFWHDKVIRGPRSFPDHWLVYSLNNNYLDLVFRCPHCCLRLESLIPLLASSYSLDLGVNLLMSPGLCAGHSKLKLPEWYAYYERAITDVFRTLSKICCKVRRRLETQISCHSVVINLISIWML